MEGPAGLLLALVVFALFTLAGYHRLSNLKNQALNAISDLEGSFEELWGSVPKIINKADYLYQHREKDFAELRRLSNVLTDNNLAISARIKADNEWRQKLPDILRLGNKHPDNEDWEEPAEMLEEFMQKSIRINEQREAFNNAVSSYNSACFHFPSNVFAMVFRFTPYAVFKNLDDTMQFRKSAEA